MQDLTHTPLSTLMLRAEALRDGCAVFDRLPVTDDTRAEVDNIVDEVHAIQAEVERRAGHA